MEGYLLFACAPEAESFANSLMFQLRSQGIDCITHSLKLKQLAHSRRSLGDSRDLQNMALEATAVIIITSKHMSEDTRVMMLATYAGNQGKLITVVHPKGKRSSLPASILQGEIIIPRTKNSKEVVENIIQEIQKITHHVPHY